MNPCTARWKFDRYSYVDVAPEYHNWANARKLDLCSDGNINYIDGKSAPENSLARIVFREYG